MGTSAKRSVDMCVFIFLIQHIGAKLYVFSLEAKNRNPIGTSAKRSVDVCVFIFIIQHTEANVHIGGLEGGTMEQDDQMGGRHVGRGGEVALPECYNNAAYV